MFEQIVANASPLILLSRAGYFQILRNVASRVIIPAEVVAEVRVRGDADVTARAISESDWLSVISAVQVSPSIAAWNLGLGESAVLAYAMEHPHTTALLDDLMARRCADSMGIPVRGTLAVVVAAKRTGALTRVRPAIDALQKAGMYVSQEILDEVLAIVDE